MTNEATQPVEEDRDDEKLPDGPFHFFVLTAISTPRRRSAAKARHRQVPGVEAAIALST